MARKEFHTLKYKCDADDADDDDDDDDDADGNIARLYLFNDFTI